MGDIKRLRKKYFTLAHPWIAAEIEESKKIKAEYGVLRRKEILIASSFLKKYKDLAKKLIANSTIQGKREAEQIMGKLQRLGMLPAAARLEDVLGLTIKDVLERRLQTQVFRKNLSRSMKQARQFITHRHIAIAGQEITSPGHLVTHAEEAGIYFKGSSPLAAGEHPERAIIAIINSPSDTPRPAPGPTSALAVNPAAGKERSVKKA